MGVMASCRAAVRRMLPGPLSSIEKIDICRGLFAFLVVAAHAMDISWVIHPQAPGALTRPVHDLLLYVAAAGVYWVIGFFVISGYCIQLSVERQVQGPGFSLRHYLAARLSRILPLYYLALLVAVVVEWLIASDRPPCWPQGVELRAFAAQLFVVQNLTQTYGSFAPSWSITNEMFYYILYGLIVNATARRGLRSTILGMGLCLVSALLLDWIYFFGFRTGYVRSPGLLFGLGIIWFQGALVAEYRGRLGHSRPARILSMFWPLVLILAMTLWYLQAVHLQVVYLVLGLAFTLMLVRFVATEPARSIPASRRKLGAFIRLLGLASYPTYVFHGPILLFTGSVIMHWNLVADWRVTWLLLATVGTGSGLFLGHVLERPVMAWRARYLARLARPQPTVLLGSEPILGTTQ